MKLSFSFALAPFVLAAPATAGAREVTYRAPLGCPPNDDVVARIHASAPEGRRADIEVVRRGDHFHGEVVLGEEKARLARSVDGRTCGAVVEALALVVALDREPADEEEREAPSAAPSPDVASEQGRAQAQPTAERAEPTATTTSDAPEVSAGVTGSGTTFQGEIFQGMSLFAGVGAARGLFDVAWLVPSARISVGRTLPLVTYRSDVSPEFTLTWTSIDACPIGARAAGTIVIAACARTDLGSLSAAHAGDEESARSRFWAAAGGIARVRWAIGSGEVRPVIEAAGGLLVHLTRDRFHFVPSESDAMRLSLYPPQSWTVSLGAGIAFR